MSDNQDMMNLHREPNEKPTFSIGKGACFVCQCVTETARMNLRYKQFVYCCGKECAESMNNKLNKK